MTILYTVLVIWVVFFLAFLLMSQFLFVFFMFKSKGSS